MTIIEILEAQPKNFFGYFTELIKSQIVEKDVDFYAWQILGMLF